VAVGSDLDSVDGKVIRIETVLDAEQALEAVRLPE
jgi:hypothetical protein